MVSRTERIFAGPRISNTSFPLYVSIVPRGREKIPSFMLLIPRDIFVSIATQKMRCQRVDYDCQEFLSQHDSMDHHLIFSVHV
jgi:hypothetical protein